MTCGELDVAERLYVMESVDSSESSSAIWLNSRAFSFKSIAYFNAASENQSYKKESDCWFFVICQRCFELGLWMGIIFRILSVTVLGGIVVNNQDWSASRTSLSAIIYISCIVVISGKLWSYKNYNRQLYVKKLNVPLENPVFPCGAFVKKANYLKMIG